MTISSDTSAAVPLVCSSHKDRWSVLFIAYTGNLEETIDVYSVEHDLYADGTQLRLYGSAQGLIWPSCVSDLDQSSLTRLRQYETLMCYWTVS